MLAVRSVFFSFPPNVLPALEQKKHWIDFASTTFEESLNDEDILASILIDGLFVQGQNGLLSPEDIRDKTLDGILLSCIEALSNPNESALFQFRTCNVARIMAYFNKLELHADLLELLSPLERYKISLAMYHTFVTSRHGIFYDQLMVDSEIDEVESILKDKRELEQQILENMKSRITVCDQDFVLV